MSSILEALEKVEAATTPGLHARPTPPRAPRRWGTVAVVLAFVAGAAATAWLSARPAPVAPARVDAPPAPKPAAPAPPRVVEAAVALPTVAPALPPVPGAMEAPRGEDASAPEPSSEDVAPSPPRAAAVPAVVPAPPPPAVAAAPPPPPDAAPAAPPPPAPVAPAAVAPPPAPDVLVPRPPADAPHVRVSFLVYSRVPERRSVALMVDGNLVTLHEGESSSGLSVARILPDRVELRHGGKTFAVVPRD